MIAERTRMFFFPQNQYVRFQRHFNCEIFLLRPNSDRKTVQFRNVDCTYLILNFQFELILTCGLVTYDPTYVKKDNRLDLMRTYNCTSSLCNIRRDLKQRRDTANGFECSYFPFIQFKKWIFFNSKLIKNHNNIVYTMFSLRLFLLKMLNCLSRDIFP